MSVASDHVPLFLTLRADRYIDSVIVSDLTSRGTWNRATKQYDTPTSSETYTGDALIRPATASTRDRGGEGEVLHTHIVHIPNTGIGVKPGNLVTIVTSVYDTDLAGAVLTVQSVGADSYNTHKELRCLLSQGGGDVG